MIHDYYIHPPGQVEAINSIITKCPDVELDARNDLGFTPLMKAAIQGRTKCAKLLLVAGKMDNLISEEN